MRNKIYIGLAGLAAVIAYSCIFIVQQTETAVILQFRKPISTITEPGLKLKAPWQDVAYFDKRILNFDAPAKTIIAGDLKRLEVDAFVKYKIAEPLKFLQSVKTKSNLEGNLDPILDDSMRKVISEVPLNTLLTTKRDEIMDDIKLRMNEKSTNYGVQIVDVRIVRADFPEKNRNDIYLRMKSEREREAKTLRAKGAEEATKIQAQADRERTKILSEAESKAQAIRGEGDSEASKIYADAFSRDPEFYKFYRSMEAYKGSLGKDNTSMVLSPDSEFLKYLK